MKIYGSNADKLYIKELYDKSNNDWQHPFFCDNCGTSDPSLRFFELNIPHPRNIRRVLPSRLCENCCSELMDLLIGVADFGNKQN